MQLHWPSLHRDDIVATPLAYATRFLVEHELSSPNMSRDYRIAFRNLIPAKAIADQGPDQRLTLLEGETGKGERYRVKARKSAILDRNNDFEEKVLDRGTCSSSRS